MTPDTARVEALPTGRPAVDDRRYGQVAGLTTYERTQHMASEISHDWQVPPTEWRYDGRPLAEFEDAMLLAHERVRIRFGGDLPRDVSLALNDAFRRGMREERERIATECEQVSGNRSPALSDEDNRRYSDIYAGVADRIRHPEKYSGCAANQDGCNAQAPKVLRAADSG